MSNGMQALLAAAFIAERTRMLEAKDYMPRSAILSIVNYEAFRSACDIVDQFMSIPMDGLSPDEIKRFVDMIS